MKEPNPEWIDSPFSGVRWTPERGFEDAPAPVSKPGFYCNYDGVPLFELKEDGTVVYLN